MDLFDAEILAKEFISRTVPYYHFAWMNKKTTYGLCSYERQTIFLSRHFAKAAEPEAVAKVILHEICHALTPGAGHGPQWCAMMRSFGQEPNRTQPSVLGPGMSNWRAVCQFCGNVTYMIRKPRRERSCAPCGKGKYDHRLKLNYVRMEK